jgi:uncharacterized protein YqjF (DUF2071 family)
VDEAELPRGRPFLTARWSNVILANFAAPAELLRPHLPNGLELDQHDGRTWCSVVAFDFFDTRVLGIPWPWHRNFPEINLRFYVRHGKDRGVVFVREFVPLRVVACLARLLYREPYAAVRMSSAVTDSLDSITIEHRLSYGGRDHLIRAVGAKPPQRPGVDSLEHFFKEHQWGYGRSRREQTLRYEVRHPQWAIYPVREFALDIDWGTLYGMEWSEMNGTKPESVIIAVGSPVLVFPRGRLLEPAEPGLAPRPLVRPMPG